jgi:hypothetical protein
VGLGFELRASSSHSSAQVTPPVNFALVILEKRSYKLFAWDGLEP